MKQSNVSKLFYALKDKPMTNKEIRKFLYDLSDKHHDSFHRGHYCSVIRDFKWSKKIFKRPDGKYILTKVGLSTMDKPYSTNTVEYWKMRFKETNEERNKLYSENWELKTKNGLFKDHNVDCTGIVGKVITQVRPMTDSEIEQEGWHKDCDGNPPMLILNNGTKLYPSCDVEGNSGGALFGTKGINHFQIR